MRARAREMQEKKTKIFNKFVGIELRLMRLTAEKSNWETSLYHILKYINESTKSCWLPYLSVNLTFQFDCKREPDETESEWVSGRSGMSVIYVVDKRL